MGGWSGDGPRTALITGAGNGIGAGTAEALAARGWSVALLDLDLEAAESVAARCGDRALALPADITDSGALGAAVAATIERFGGIDLCFANAGIGVGGTLARTDPSVLATVLDINVVGTFRTIRACLPALRNSGGYALINASASSITAPPGLGAYGASKAAVESLGDTMRRELAHEGVEAGVVYLLWVQTDMVEGAERMGEGFATTRSGMPGPLSKAMPLEKAVGAIMKGIERRARRVTAPGAVAALYRLRGLTPKLIERDMLKIAPLVDAATARDIEARGELEGAMRTDTPAALAAAEAAKARRR